METIFVVSRNDESAKNEAKMKKNNNQGQTKILAVVLNGELVMKMLLGKRMVESLKLERLIKRLLEMYVPPILCTLKILFKRKLKVIFCFSQCQVNCRNLIS